MLHIFPVRSKITHAPFAGLENCSNCGSRRPFVPFSQIVTYKLEVKREEKSKRKEQLLLCGNVMIQFGLAGATPSILVTDFKRT